MMSPDHKVLHYEVFSTSLLPPPSRAQIFFSTPNSPKPSSYVPPSVLVTTTLTHTKKKIGKIIILYVLVFILLDSLLGRQNTLHRMIASIP